MRIALFSDIHGNPLALDAVLKDMQGQGEIDAYWVLGDFAALGYDPVTPLQRVVALPNARFLRGNTDRYVVADNLSAILEQKFQVQRDLPLQMLEMAQSFSWTRGYISAHGWFDWLANLPLEQRLTLPDGTRLLGVHAAPGTDDGPGIHPMLSDSEIETLVSTSEADLICVGHTHFPLDRTVNGIRVINLGSVSNPVTPALQASYVLLEADPSGYTLEFRQVPYDRQAVIDKVHKSRHPAGDFLIQFMQGKNIVDWANG